MLELVGHQTIIGLNEEALAEWQEYRKEKNKPLSPLALTKTKNLLLRHGHDQQQHMVDVAIMNDWQGLHPVDPPKIQTSRQTSIADDLRDTSWA